MAASSGIGHGDQYSVSISGQELRDLPGITEDRDKQASFQAAIDPEVNLIALQILSKALPDIPLKKLENLKSQLVVQLTTKIQTLASNRFNSDVHSLQGARLNITLTNEDVHSLIRSLVAPKSKKGKKYLRSLKDEYKALAKNIWKTPMESLNQSENRDVLMAKINRFYSVSASIEKIDGSHSKRHIKDRSNVEEIHGLLERFENHPVAKTVRYLIANSASMSLDSFKANINEPDVANLIKSDNQFKREIFTVYADKLLDSHADTVLKSITDFIIVKAMSIEFNYVNDNFSPRTDRQDEQQIKKIIKSEVDKINARIEEFRYSGDYFD